MERICVLALPHVNMKAFPVVGKQFRIFSMKSVMGGKEKNTEDFFINLSSSVNRASPLCILKFNSKI